MTVAKSPPTLPSWVAMLPAMTSPVLPSMLSVSLVVYFLPWTVIDLADRGMLDNTLVVWMGEFGRTPKLKADGGRDHYAEGWVVGMSGCGIRGGQVIGATDKDGLKVTERPLDVPDLYQSICKALDIDPHYEYITNDNRPLKLVEKGKVIDELFTG